MSMDKDNEQPQNSNACCVGPSSPLSGIAPSCQGCPNMKSCSSKKTDSFKSTKTDIKEKIAKNLSNIKFKLLILSGKGGVGKSTFAVQLTKALAYKHNLTVGLLDIDICGPSIPHLLEIEPETVTRSATGWTPVWTENGRVAVMSVGFLLNQKNEAVIWRGPRKTSLISSFLSEVVWDVDILVVDCPPGTSDEHISIVSLLIGQEKNNNTEGIVVTTPSRVAFEDVLKELDFCKKTKLKVMGVVENMKGTECPHCKQHFDLFEDCGVERFCEKYGYCYLGGLRFCREMEKVISESIIEEEEEEKEENKVKEESNGGKTSLNRFKGKEYNDATVISSKILKMISDQL